MVCSLSFVMGLGLGLKLGMVGGGRGVSGWVLVKGGRGVIVLRGVKGGM